MAEAGTAYIEFRGDYSRLDREARTAGTRAGTGFSSGFGRTLGTGLAGAGRAIAGFARTGALALGGLTVAGGAWGLSVAAQAEQAEIAFTTMLGSGEKARAFLDELKTFAAETPFEFPELQTAASSLIAAGVEASKVIPIMTTLGDVTSGMGTGSEGVQRATIALQQMAAAGRITGEDLNQLRDAGVPVFDLLAAATGKSKEEVAALAQQGKLGRQEMEQLFAALESGEGLERFSGLMEAQSQSLAGLVSTLKDTLGQGLAEALQPVIPLLKEMIPNITAVAGNLTGLFGGLVETLAPVVLPLLEKLGGLLTGVLGSALDALKPALGPIVSLLEEVGGILGDVLVDALDALAPLFPILADAIEKMSPLITELVRGLGDELVDALKDLIPVMVENSDQMIPLIEAFLELAIALLPIIGPLAQLAGLFARFSGLLVGSVIAPVISGIASALAGLVQFDYASAFGAILNFFSRLPGLVGGALRAIPGAVTRFVSETLPRFRQAGIDFVTGLVRGLAARLPYLFGFVAGFVASTPGRLVGLVVAAREKGQEMIAALLRAITSAVPGVISFLRGIPGRAVEALSALVPRILDLGRKAINALVRGLASGVPALLSWVRGLPGQMISAFGNLTGRLFDIGTDIVAGLIRGIRSMAGAVRDVVGSIVSDITSGFTDALKIGSPSKVFEGYGVNIAEGLNRGLEKSSALVTAGVSSLVGDLEPTSVFATAGTQGDIVLEVDGYEIGRARSVYRGMADRAKMDRGGRR